MMLHTKYKGSWPCGFRQEDFFMFSPYKPMWPLGRDRSWPQGHNLNKVGRGPLGDARY